MRVDILRVRDVRNYAEAEFRPAASTTVVYGPNGAGKSNLLEGIGLFSTLASPRAGHLGVLVRQGAQEAGLHLDLDTGAGLEIRLRGGRLALRAGGSGAVARTFLGRFRAVLFTPDDLDLVRGEPDLRRKALDELIVQLRPAYRGVRQQYDRALRQRNTALRHGRPRDAASYDAPLAEAGAHVLDARRRLVAELSGVCADLYDQLAGKGTLAIAYRTTAVEAGLTVEDAANELRTRYAEGLQTDLERGSTRVGPHRDDLDIEVNGFSAKHYASRGEQRSAALAFRIAQLRQLSGAVLLLDDVLSELDTDRRVRLFHAVRDDQVIVATADRQAVPAEAKVEAEWTVTRGVLCEAG